MAGIWDAAPETLYLSDSLTGASSCFPHPQAVAHQDSPAGETWGSNQDRKGA